MNEDFKSRHYDHGEFLELCALAPTGELKPREWAALEEHMAACEGCRATFASYQGPALRGMASLAALRNPMPDPGSEARAWNEDLAKERLLASVTPRPEAAAPRDSRAARSREHNWRSLAAVVGAAALLLLSVSFAYRFGYRRGQAQRPSPSTPVAQISHRDLQLPQQLAQLRAQGAKLHEQLAAERARIKALAFLASRQANLLAELKKSYAPLATQNQQQIEALTAAGSEQDQLQRRLTETRNSLAITRNDLFLEQAQYRDTRLHAATLESQVSQLTARLREREATIRLQQKYLAADGDIRNMMGARQLYIADVFDVDGGGKTRKAFGRVFYTEGKSLVFYAFDLDQKPDHGQSQAFQAWAREGEHQSKPVSLGIFYMDDSTNRRWVLKSDDPRLLADINSVFVTVEPKGGSKKPTGRPFLYAYLHEAPINHP